MTPEGKFNANQVRGRKKAGGGDLVKGKEKGEKIKEGERKLDKEDEGMKEKKGRKKGGQGRERER